jgi:hypothetical protein
MDVQNIPEMPDPEEPEHRGGNTLWKSGKIAVFLAAVFGYYKFPFLSIVALALMLAGAEYMRFYFSRHTGVGLVGSVGLLFTSALWCSALYGAGRLASYVWPAAG